MHNLCIFHLILHNRFFLTEAVKKLRRFWKRCFPLEEHLRPLLQYALPLRMQISPVFQTLQHQKAYIVCKENCEQIVKMLKIFPFQLKQ